MKVPNRKSDQRATYRVRSAGEGASAFIVLPSGRARVALEDLSARGCGLVVPTVVGVGLVLEDPIMLRLSVGGAGMPLLLIRGVIKGIREAEGGLRVGVQFDDLKALYNQLKEPQWRFFNRRQAFRVPPTDECGGPLCARFHIFGTREPWSWPIHDLSSSGLSVWLDPKHNVLFPKHLPIRVCFQLPGTEEEQDLRMIFVHRTKIGGNFRVGFRIDQARTVDHERQEEHIIRYVLERQRQLLAAA